MRTKVSSKGQVVLAKALVKRLGLRPGDSVEVRVHGDAIFLRAVRTKVWKLVTIKDPITGLSVLSAGKGAPKLTHKQVRAMVDGFP